MVALRKTGGDLESSAHQAPGDAAKSAFRSGFSGGLEDYSRQSAVRQDRVALWFPRLHAYPTICAQHAESRDE
jgi:hypothetical protein